MTDFAKARAFGSNQFRVNTGFSQEFVTINPGLWQPISPRGGNMAPGAGNSASSFFSSIAYGFFHFYGGMEVWGFFRKSRNFSGLYHFMIYEFLNVLYRVKSNIRIITSYIIRSKKKTPSTWLLFFWPYYNKVEKKDAKYLASFFSTLL